MMLTPGAPVSKALLHRELLDLWKECRPHTLMDPSRPVHRFKKADWRDAVFKLRSGLAPEGFYFWWVECDGYVVEQWLDGHPTLPQFSPQWHVEAR